MPRSGDSAWDLPIADSEQRFGRYWIVDRIGEGGMGIVYLAEQLDPVRRTVALKTIKPHSNAVVSARFETERQALVVLNHPNIVAGLDADEADDGQPFLVMELVKGIPITEYCDRYRLDLGERLSLVVGVCRGVQHVHDTGIVHRDIKPGNVLVAVHDARAVPKIIDFGLARFVSSRLTRSLASEVRRIVGTPEYMSPEQADICALDVDKRTDVYSLGALTYQLLVGRPPFGTVRKSARWEEWRELIQDQEVLPPSSHLAKRRDKWKRLAQTRSTDVGRLLHQLRGGLDHVVMKAMHQDPTRRFQTAAALADSIEECLRRASCAGRIQGTKRGLRGLFNRATG